MEEAMAEPGEILPERNIDMEGLYDMLRRSKDSVENVVAEMLAIKKDARPKTHIRELTTQVLLNFVYLRQANRSILIEEDRVKAETERAKTPVDFTTLQLHNLMYEKNHYVKAIKACKDFKTKYPDIDLVPEEDYFREAAEDIKGLVLSSDVAHDLMLKRLNFENFQRKELCKLCDKLEQQKSSLQEMIANRNKFLSSLPSHLKALKKASLPVQNHLAVPHAKKLKQQQLAELLPPPLYVTYSQLFAQKEAFGEKIELEIIGSVKDAQAFARQLANKDIAASTNIDNSKMEDDVPEDDDDGQRRRKRPNKVPSRDNLDESIIYQSHPLKLTLQVFDDASNFDPVKLVILKFEYLIKLNVVCVGVEGFDEGHPDNLLCNLFPDDTGLELPIKSARLCIGNSYPFDKKRSLRPYKWAQHLAGIDFLPEVSPLFSAAGDTIMDTSKHASILSGLSLYHHQNRVQTVVQRIRARKKAQLALEDVLDSLTKLKWPALTCEATPWASHIPRCELHGWLSMSFVSDNGVCLRVADIGQGQGSSSFTNGRIPGVSKDEMEAATEDGELPSLLPVATSVTDVQLAPLKKPDIEHSRSLSLISKSIISPLSKGKLPSFKKYEEDVDLLLEFDNETDEQQLEDESDDALPSSGLVENSWLDYGVKEYSLILARNLDSGDKNMKLEAKIKIGLEYPLRPPIFELRLNSSLRGENCPEINSSKWYNELRAMEAEVNVHMIRTIPSNQENSVLGHQVRCLAMLFDLFLEDEHPSPQKNCTSVIDIGLCKPVSGGLVSRSFRGRDRRKMISCKNQVCTPGYPY